MSWAFRCALRSGLDPLLPSALPCRQEGLERRVNLCRSLLVREVSSPGNRRCGEILGEAAPELGHVDHLCRLELASPQGEGRAAELDVLVLFILCDVLSPGPIVLKRAAQPARLRI